MALQDSVLASLRNLFKPQRSFVSPEGRAENIETQVQPQRVGITNMYKRGASPEVQQRYPYTYGGYPSSYEEKQAVSPRVPAEFSPTITSAAQKYNLPVDLFSNLLAHESMGFDPAVLYGQRLSPAGAMGVAQFMPDTYSDVKRMYGDFDVYNPQQAIPASAYYLNYLRDQFGGNLPYAVAAYNAGMGNVQNAINTMPENYFFGDVLRRLPTETQGYLPAVYGL